MIILCIHGAGLAGASFTLLAEQIKQFSSLATYDMMGHGYNKMPEMNINYTLGSLTQEAGDVLLFLAKEFPMSTFVLVGHSLGGSIAS